jgi:hypothetical protein
MHAANIFFMSFPPSSRIEFCPDKYGVPLLQRVTDQDLLLCEAGGVSLKVAAGPVNRSNKSQ